MAEQLLDVSQVRAPLQHVAGHAVPQAVRGEIRQTRELRGHGVHGAAGDAHIQGAATGADQQRSLLRLREVSPHRRPALQSTRTGDCERDDPLLGALTHDLDGTPIKIHIAHRDRARLADSQSTAVQQFQEHQIPDRDRVVRHSTEGVQRLVEPGAVGHGRQVRVHPRGPQPKGRVRVQQAPADRPAGETADAGDPAGDGGRTGAGGAGMGQPLTHGHGREAAIIQRIQQIGHVAAVSGRGVLGEPTLAAHVLREGRQRSDQG